MLPFAIEVIEKMWLHLTSRLAAGSRTIDHSLFRITVLIGNEVYAIGLYQLTVNRLLRVGFQKIFVGGVDDIVVT